MWMLLPMVSLLIRAIIGNPEIDESTLSVVIGLGNESNNLVTEKRSSNDIWETFKGESFKEMDNAKTINRDNVETEEGNGKIVVRVIYAESERLTTVLKGIRKVSQEKASPWLYSWENRRPSIEHGHGSSISCICRQLRLPTSSKRWNDKREKEYFDRSNVDLQTKRTKLTYDGYGRDTAVDEFNGIKRVAKMRKVGSKTPFNSWGGKRAEEQSIDREQFSQLSLGPNDRRLHFANAIKDVSPAGKDAGEIDYEKHAVRMINGISAVYQNWNRKRNHYPYPIPSRIYNETNQHDYTNDITDWLIPIHDKKSEQHGQYKKTKFNPWGGKRSSKACTFRFGNNYLTTPAYAETRPKGFPSTTGREYI
ncbi:unnamed protein product [Xylocopa violacea]|uniref:Uncharacterized protein n=1 Tax=Xylocopa violacea TaxID=135666 RepID=A0ABP1NEA2_XYLVO